MEQIQIRTGWHGLSQELYVNVITEFDKKTNICLSYERCNITFSIKKKMIDRNPSQKTYIEAKFKEYGF